MSELLKVFGTYDEIEKEYFFTYHFNSLPSALQLKTPLADNKKNIELVLSQLNLGSLNFELILKNWNTEDASNADFNLDFPYEYLFKSTTNECVIFISLENDTLKIDYLYNCNNIELEQWVIESNHKIRSKFGLNRSPTFKVLTKEHSSFDTEDVRLQEISIDIKANYNDDFIEVDEKIKTALASEKSGIILLHGHPGTGKTTYIKGLITKHHKQNFIFIQNEFVSNLLDPDFVSFLLKQKNTILIIEDAEKVISSREEDNKNSVVSTILQLTDGLFSDYLNIKVICTFNTSLSKVDKALLRKGRMIAMYKFEPLTIEKTNSLLKSINEDKHDKELTVADIYNHKESNFNDNLQKKKIGF